MEGGGSRTPLWAWMWKQGQLRSYLENMEEVRGVLLSHICPVGVGRIPGQCGCQCSFGPGRAGIVGLASPAFRRLVREAGRGRPGVHSMGRQRSRGTKAPGRRKASRGAAVVEGH